MEVFHVTKADVEMVLAHQYTQGDFSREIGEHKTVYNVINNYPDYDEAFWQTALVMEVVARQAKYDYTPVDLDALLVHLKNHTQFNKTEELRHD